MIGPLTIGRKAAKYGYKRYGVPGAIVAGLGGVRGYVFVKRKLTGGKSSDEQDASDTDVIDDVVSSAESNGTDDPSTDGSSTEDDGSD